MTPFLDLLEKHKLSPPCKSKSSYDFPRHKLYSCIQDLHKQYLNWQNYDIYWALARGVILHHQKILVSPSPEFSEFISLFGYAFQKEITLNTISKHIERFREDADTIMFECLITILDKLAKDKMYDPSDPLVNRLRKFLQSIVKFKIASFIKEKIGKNGEKKVLELDTDTDRPSSNFEVNASNYDREDSSFSSVQVSPAPVPALLLSEIIDVALALPEPKEIKQKFLISCYELD